MSLLIAARSPRDDHLQRFGRYLNVCRGLSNYIAVNLSQDGRIGLHTYVPGSEALYGAFIARALQHQAQGFGQ